MVGGRDHPSSEVPEELAMRCLLETLDIETHVPVILLALSTFKARTHLRCFAVEIGK